MSVELDREKYNQQVLQDIRKENLNYNPVVERVHIVSFESRSAGHGRKRKVGREVTLLVVDNSYAHVVTNNEIKPRKRNDHIKIDVLANEILDFLEPEDRTIEKLLSLTPKKR